MEEISTIMRDTSQPWALVNCHDNDSGNGIENEHNAGEQFNRSPPTEGLSPSAHTTDRGDISTDVTSITDLGGDSVNSYKNANTAAVEHAFPLPWLSMSTHSEPPLRYDRELTIEDDIEEGGQGGNAASGTTKAGVTNTAVAYAKHNCITQPHGCAEVRVGFDREIPRWKKGSVLTYVVFLETFPHDLSTKIEPAMVTATSAWQNIGVTFRQVGRHDQATFAVMYKIGQPTVFARAFFPNESRRELTVFEDTRQVVDHLAGILSHEVGHILGLRHEFAHTRENGMGMQSALFGNENARSVMNYFDHVEQYQVQKTDLEELRSFYEHDKAEYMGLPIRDIDPEERLFIAPSRSDSASSVNSAALDTASSPAVDFNTVMLCAILMISVRILLLL